MSLLAARLAGLLLCLFSVLAWAAPGSDAAGPVAIPALSARVTDLTGTLTFATAATASSVPNAYAVTPSGLSGANYTLTFIAGTLTVNPAPLTKP